MIQEFTGRSRYRAYLEQGPHTLFVAIPCIVGAGRDPIQALLDTASEWCILEPDVARLLGYDPDAGQIPAVMHTRFGALHGSLERIRLRFAALEGESLEVEATWFISRDWPGPSVLGWRGCLERFQWTLNQAGECFYFAPLSQRETDPAG